MKTELTRVRAARLARRFRPSPRLGLGALNGVLAAGVAVGAGELAAALAAPKGSPVLAVAGAVIDLSPEWLKSFAIATFGQDDKIVLVGGIMALLSLAAMLIGVAARRHPVPAALAVAAFGLIGAAAALSRPGAVPFDALPAALGTGAGIAALRTLTHAVRRMEPGEGSSSALANPAWPDGSAAGLRPADGSASLPLRPETGDRSLSRRRFVLTAGAMGVLAAVAGSIGVLSNVRRSEVEAGAVDVPLPVPADPAPPIPAAADFSLPDLSPYVTPNGAFYRVDTAILAPSVAPDTWRLRIHGMVDRELTLSLTELLARPTIERDITLACVSNPVGGPYVGNARWIGVPLKPLLEEAGVRPGADQIVSRSVDGMTIGTPTVAVLDGRDAMIAVAMNGAPLPVEHGYPARMIVPGLYGYVSATKWLTEIELSTFAAFDPYWVARGWAPEAPVKTASRIDTPRAASPLRAGRIPVAGVAWAQHRGIERVEVRVDGGPWSEATLAIVETIDTWRQWLFMWDAAAGRHTLEVRATDRAGEAQPEERTEPFPDGATGWHKVVVTVA